MQVGEQRRLRDERGAAVVDFVLVLFILIPLFLGIVQLALVLHVRNVLSTAAAEAARAGSVSGAGPAECQAEARQMYAGAVSATFVREVRCYPQVVDGAAMMRSEIDVNVSALGLGGPGVTFRVSGVAVREAGP